MPPSIAVIELRVYTLESKVGDHDELLAALRDTCITMDKNYAILEMRVVGAEKNLAGFNGLRTWFLAAVGSLVLAAAVTFVLQGGLAGVTSAVGG